jgi:hypothetical protein
VITENACFQRGNLARETRCIKFGQLTFEILQQFSARFR